VKFPKYLEFATDAVLSQVEGEHREPSAASGFALGRNQKVRPTKKLHKILLIRRLRSVKTKIVHKKQRFERLYYREIVNNPSCEPQISLISRMFDSKSPIR
jgi:hypothetical protein